MEHLQGRTAVVTGAASGIGLAITEAFLDAGMRVVMADFTDDGRKSKHLDYQWTAPMWSPLSDVSDPPPSNTSPRPRSTRSGNCTSR